MWSAIDDLVQAEHRKELVQQADQYRLWKALIKPSTFPLRVRVMDWVGRSHSLLQGWRSRQPRAETPSTTRQPVVRL